MSKSLSRNTGHFPKTLALIAAIVLLVLAVFFALEKFNITNLTNVSTGSKSDTTTGGNTGPTKEEQAAQAQSDATQKQDYLDTTTKTDTSTPSDTTNDTSQSSTDSTTPTLALSASQDGGSVTVLTRIQNIPEGLCKLSVKNGSKSTSQTAQIIYQTQFSSCAGFSVPVSSVGTGTWAISLTATSKSGSEITKYITLEVK